jgi:hypothetical protein
MSLPDKCASEAVSLNSAKRSLQEAQAQVDQAQASLNTCLPPQQQAAARLAGIQDGLGKYNAEAVQLGFLNAFLLGALEREVGNDTTLSGLGQIAEAKMNEMQNEIEELKSQIRKERRVFLDSAPSVSPAVGGLYFTKVPDNQVLIALLSTVGLLLVSVSLILYLGYSPIDALARLTGGERLKLIGLMWIGTAIVGYIGLFTFT